jgi:pimeloyl-ACP methyl ester carboxylesterase
VATQLKSNGNPVRVGSLTLRTPGLEGVATSHRPGSTDMRSAEDMKSALEQALSKQDVRPQETIDISGTREIPLSRVSTRTTQFDEPAIVVEAPDPGDNFGQFVLYVDESGVMTWNFAVTAAGSIDTSRGAGKRTYVVPRAVAPTPEKAGTRGLIGAVGRKVLKVLVFPLIDPILGQVGDYFVQRWERKNRVYRTRSFTPDNYRASDVANLDSLQWKALAAGRSLLLIHGTFSRTDSAFFQLHPEFVRSLFDKYQGRVFAFDHFTLSDDPTTNVDWFLKQVPDGLNLEVDIVCHSRGGLVSRILAERSSTLTGSPVQVKRIVFVGTPNAGTILTDAKHMGSFLDSYTNILNYSLDLLPETGIVDVAQMIIAVAKQLSVDTLSGLGGLESMLPGGVFLKELNCTASGGEKEYFAIASNYEPLGNAGWRMYAASRLTQRIFKTQNDLVVPTAGVYDSNGSELFPIHDTHLFGPSDGVDHCSYFGNQTARDMIDHWLAM